MIGYLDGTVVDVDDGTIVLLCGKVGYAVQIPTGLAAPLPMEGDALSLHVVTLVRQDAIVLCGLGSTAEKRIFNKLLAIQGVGPRLALSILGTLGSEGLLQAAAAADRRRIQGVPGVGKKTAERVVLELKDKLNQLAPGVDGVEQKALADGGAAGVVLRQALDALGFKRAEIDMALQNVRPVEGETEQQLVTRALKFLRQAKARR